MALLGAAAAAGVSIGAILWYRHRNRNTAAAVTAASSAHQPGQPPAAPPPPPTTTAADERRRTGSSSSSNNNRSSCHFAAFLSHYKLECGGDARLVHNCLKEELPEGSNVFLDSDDLNDLRLLLGHVRNSSVLVLLQSKGVLTRPWYVA